MPNCIKGFFEIQEGHDRDSVFVVFSCYEASDPHDLIDGEVTRPETELFINDDIILD